MNHGVFSFGNNAKQSYGRMIEIVSLAEKYLKRSKVFRVYTKAKPKTDLLKLCEIRQAVSKLTNTPCIALLNTSSEAVGFSKMENAPLLSISGTLTPDHVIRTKPFGMVINDNLKESIKEFEKIYLNILMKINLMV